MKIKMTGPVSVSFKEIKNKPGTLFYFNSTGALGAVHAIVRLGETDGRGQEYTYGILNLNSFTIINFNAQDNMGVTPLVGELLLASIDGKPVELHSSTHSEKN